VITRPLAALGILLCTFTASGQTRPARIDTSRFFQISLKKDKQEYFGKIRAINGDQIPFDVYNGELISLSKTNVKRIAEIDTSRLRKGVYWFENPHRARYFFSPSGYGLGRGEAYYQNVQILGNHVAVGFTNNFSIGTGYAAFSLSEQKGFWVIPKISIPIKRNLFNIAGGVLYGKFSHNDEVEKLVLPFVITTLGGGDFNASIGIGWANSNGMWAKDPTAGLSIVKRVSRLIYLMSDNYFIARPDHNMVMSIIGGRYMFKRSVGLDFGCLMMRDYQEYGGFTAIPMIGLNVKGTPNLKYRL
jgi:hypothetical protein